MDQESGTQDGEAPVADWIRDFVVRFAMFLKASFLYPSNNDRVRDSCEQVRLALRMSPGDTIVLKLHGRGFLVGDVDCEIDHPLVRWLHDSFLKAALGGVVLRRLIGQESLAWFADELRRCYTADSSNFERLWIDRIEDITPLELRFSGNHLDGAGPADETLPIGTASDKHDPVLESFLADEQLMSRLDELQKVLTVSLNGESEVEDEEFATIDLLDAIRTALPAEARADPKRAAEFLDEILATAETRILDSLKMGAPASGNSMEAMVTDLGRRLFASSGQSGASAENVVAVAANALGTVGVEAATKVSVDAVDKLKVKAKVETAEGEGGLADCRHEDEGVLEDIDAMIEEFEALPVLDDLSLLEGGEAQPAETIGVCLHLLVTIDDEKIVRRVRDQLVTILSEHPELEERLVPYLDAGMLESQEHDGLQLWRVVAFAHDLQLRSLLDRGGYLTAAVVGRTFPNLFLTFLDRIDPWGGGRVQQEVDMLLAAVGTRRMLRVARDLVHSGDLLQGNRLEIALSTGHDAMAPTIEHLAPMQDESIRKLIVGYLLQRSPATAEATALRVVRPFSALSVDYLTDLAKPRQNEAHRKRLRSSASKLVRSFLRSTVDQEDMTEFRLLAVQQLQALPSHGNLNMLKELRRSGVLNVLSAQQRQLRKAAQDSYAHMKEQLEV